MMTAFIGRCARLMLSLLFCLGVASAQISISPKRILLNPGDRSREVIVTNTGAKPFEISAAVNLLILRTDSLGHDRFDTTASPDELARSCHAWVKVFPRKFTLMPNATRKIRVLAMPPADLQDGEYVSRLLLSSMESVVRRPRDTIDTANITVDLHFKMNMILQVVYRKGSVTTGIELGNPSVVRSDSGTFLLVDAKATGNASYRGMLCGVLRSEDGRSLDSVSTPYVVEIVGIRQRLPMKDIPDGSYELTVESRAELPGSAAEMVIPAMPVRSSYRLVVSGKTIALTAR